MEFQPLNSEYREIGAQPRVGTRLKMMWQKHNKKFVLFLILVLVIGFIVMISNENGVNSSRVATVNKINEKHSVKKNNFVQVDKRVLLGKANELETVVPIEISAVGRVAELGELYDQRTDQFLRISLFQTRLDNKSINSAENRETKLQFTMANSLGEKFKLLDISAELKMSMMAGIVELKGSGRFFKDAKTSRRSAKASLINSFNTAYDSVSITSKIILPNINFDILQEVDATHVVVGIQWGGEIFVSVEDLNEQNLDKEHVEGNLGMKIKMLIGTASGEGSVNITDKDRQDISRFNFEVYGSVVPEEVPQDLLQAIKFMKTAPKQMQQGNSGKGKAIKYVMLPIKQLRDLFKVSVIINTFVRKVDEETIKKCVTFFDNMNLIEQKLNDMHADLKSMDPFIETAVINSFEQLQQNYELFQSRVRRNLSETLIRVRSGNESVNQLENILIDALQDPFSWQSIELNLEQFRIIEQEIAFIKMFDSLGVQMLSKYINLQLFLWENFNRDIFILFYNYNKTEAKNLNATNHFRRMVGDKNYFKALFVAVNNKVFFEEISKKTSSLFENESNQLKANEHPAKISYFRNGELIVDNFDYQHDGTQNDTDDGNQWSMAYMQKKLQEMMISVDELNNNTVPIGFIYVQLPQQPSPIDIWPHFSWTDVSQLYAGHFFRVIGDGSKGFGQPQTECSPRIVTVEAFRRDTPEHNHDSKSLLPENEGVASEWLPKSALGTGAFRDDGGIRDMNFRVSKCEVRPKNQAVIVWKRIK